MDQVKTILEALERTQQSSGKTLNEIVSINDLRDKEEQGNLTNTEQAALSNYEKYRIKKLNEASNEEDFHGKYQLLQVLANLSPYEEFLDDKYKV